MPEQLFTLLRRLSPYWENFSPVQRVAMAIVAASAVVLASYFLLQGPEYSAVFTKLNDRDASAIVAKLKEFKVSYQLTDGGSTVLVPTSQVYETRLRLAGEGLPQTGTVGFELFNQTNIGATDFTQKLNYQRALEGELARTIARLAGVEQARVHLALPQPSLFTEQQKSPSASVVLELRPNLALTSEQIRGVTHLVSSAVEGLTPEHVTLLDARGKVLASGADNGALGSLNATSTQLELQRTYERSLVTNVQDLLDRTLGPGKGIVTASVLLDWDRFESNSELYSPKDAPAQVRSSREVVESSSNDGATSSGGVPGVESNVATSYQQAGGASNAKTERRDTTQNFELSKSVERISRMPGSIKRMTVSVVLDSAIPPEQVAQLEKAIPAAVGIDTSRGDVVQVSSVPFDRSSVEAEQKDMEESRRQAAGDQLLELARKVGLPTLLLLVLAVAGLVALRRQRPAVRSLPGPAAVVTEVVDGSPMVEMNQRRRMLREQVTTLVREDPQVISQVIRTWLIEDGKGVQ